MNNKDLPKSRFFGPKYYLADYDPFVTTCKEACEKCELSDICDQLADDLNHIEYCICLHGIKDKKFKVSCPGAYFRDINNVDWKEIGNKYQEKYGHFFKDE